MDVVTRSIVVWIPDWPVIAVRREAGVAKGEDTPLMLVEKGMVSACSRSARDEGVRRGQRRRDAQARCPQIEVIEADAVRDLRVFSPLIREVELRAPGVQMLRPGLLALRARGPARYYGGEDEAAAMLVRALRGQELADVRAAVADGPFTAEQAARMATQETSPVVVIPPGRSGDFLARLPVSVLVDGDADAHRAIDLFARLGAQTLGAVAAMPPERLAERFGPRGHRWHALASGHDSRPVTSRTPPPEFHRQIAFEAPLEQAEQVAFGLRIVAEDFLAGLGTHDLVCTELRVIVSGDRGERSERVWLHPAAFDAPGILDRVRWQLAEDDDIRSGVVAVRLEPEAVDAAAHHAVGLFGSGPEERVHHALSRVQAMLGHRGVLVPTVSGGRWLSERQTLVPWGDRNDSGRDRDRPWPGSLPDPLPATVFSEPVLVEVVAADGQPVDIDERGDVTAAPAELILSSRRRRVQGWAGPWPVVERMWDPVRARRAHRFQLVDADQTAWLTVCEDGAWHVEGRYD